MTVGVEEGGRCDRWEAMEVGTLGGRRRSGVKGVGGGVTGAGWGEEGARRSAEEEDKVCDDARKKKCGGRGRGVRADISPPAHRHSARGQW
jgi:hypothetical protein